jgi:hypothetical protein
MISFKIIFENEVIKVLPMFCYFSGSPSSVLFKIYCGLINALSMNYFFHRK